jgi:predicted naringenin-chalcone synthase
MMPTPTYLHAVSGVVPPNAYRQQDLAADLAIWLGADHRQGLLIHTRYSVLPSLAGALVHPGAAGERWLPADTAWRNHTYRPAAAELLLALGRQIMAKLPQVPATSVTHLITASCTGFGNPGPELRLIQELGMSPNLARFHLGFMGCSAGVPALRLASAICQADPQARVLVLAVECCSLHLQLAADHDALLGAALFADGAGGGLVSSAPPAGDQEAWRLDGFANALLLVGQEAMDWRLGNTGFPLTLTDAIPELLATAGVAALRDLLPNAVAQPASFPLWAIHPGGPRILRRLSAVLGLSEAMLAPSWQVLQDYGNMSSATLFFVLQAAQAPGAPAYQGATLAMAFAPGLSLELAQMQLLRG